MENVVLVKVLYREVILDIKIPLSPTSYTNDQYLPLINSSSLDCRRGSNIAKMPATCHTNSKFGWLRGQETEGQLVLMTETAG